MKTQLNALNRIACTATTVITKTTPQASLELIFDIMPLDLYILQTGLTTYCRIKTQLDQPWVPKKSMSTPHLHYWNQMLRESGATTADDRCSMSIWNRAFKINTDSFKSTVEPTNNEITIYTDGSKMKEGVGSGFVILQHSKVIHRDNFALPSKYTVFMAEIHALHKAGQYILKNHSKYKNIKICCDSQAAILAVKNTNIKSKLVANTVSIWNIVANRNITVTLEWVKAHIGILGNELADTQAKMGAQNPNKPNTEILPWGEKKNCIEEFVREKWKDRWTKTTGHRQTKLFYAHPERIKAKGILALSRGNLSLLIKAITGQNLLGYHQHITDNNISQVCRLCEQDVETFWHLVDECPRLEQTRRDIFLDQRILPDLSWSIKKLMCFINLPVIHKMLTSKTGLQQIEEYDYNPYFSLSGSDLDNTI